MFTFFKKNKYPSYFKDYLNSFKIKPAKSIKETRFVVFDTETTGLNPNEDRILSIGAVCITNGYIDVSDNFEKYLIQEKFEGATVEIHGILKDGNIAKITEKQAVIQFINFIKNGVFIAHHAAFDVEMINKALFRLKLPKLKNKVIDTGILYKKLNGKQNAHYNLDALCNEFNITKHDRHTANGDAFITALLFLKIVAALKKERTLHFSDLFRSNQKSGLL